VHENAMKDFCCADFAAVVQSVFFIQTTLEFLRLVVASASLRRCLVVVLLCSSCCANYS